MKKAKKCLRCGVDFETDYDEGRCTKCLGEQGPLGTRTFTIVLSDAVSKFLELEAASRGLTTEEWLTQKVYAAGSTHNVKGWTWPPREKCNGDHGEGLALSCAKCFRQS